MLLVTNWQSTHRMTLSVIMMDMASSTMTVDATSNMATIRSSSIRRNTMWQAPEQTTTIAHEIDRFHFCGKPRVTAYNNNSEAALNLLYQCVGPQYDDFAANLRTLAYNQSQQHSHQSPINDLPLKQEQCTATTSHSMPTHPQWGKRDYPLPPNTTVLVLGNSHLRQISKTLACQYAHALKSIHLLPTLLELSGNSSQNHNETKTQNSDGFVLEFDNGSRWISITNSVLAYSTHWKELIQDFFLSSFPSLENLDAVILGKFTTHAEAQHTRFEHTMQVEQDTFDEIATRRRVSRLVDFHSMAPPALVDVAKIYHGPLISVSMFSSSDVVRFRKSYERYQEECRASLGSDEINMNERKVHLVDSRKYIDQLEMECGTDDKNAQGTCHEPPLSSRPLEWKRGRDPSDMHRCVGEGGGHADLIAWDVVEALFAML
jgi:hypothetical protein